VIFLCVEDLVKPVLGRLTQLFKSVACCCRQRIVKFQSCYRFEPDQDILVELADDGPDFQVNVVLKVWPRDVAFTHFQRELWLNDFGRLPERWVDHYYLD